MTPTQLARAECANYDNGACIGGGRCKLHDSQPCEYFAQHVLAAVKWITDPYRLKMYRKAANQYNGAGGMEIVNRRAR